jgi:hypothetical protein
MTTTTVLHSPVTRSRARWFTPLVVVGLLLTATLAVTLVNPRGNGNTDDLDPANPGFTGAQGLAHVLSDHGVAVTIVRSQRELLDQSVDGATTVAITGTQKLSARTARTAMTHAASAASLVLLDPDPEVTRGMGLPVASRLTDLTKVRAGCLGTDLGEDFQLAAADRAYVPAATGSGATTCFPDKSNGGGALVSLPAGAGRAPVILIGNESLIVNGAILDADNAAIALRLFGHTNRLIWYVPSAADIAAADSTSRSIAPSWFQPGLVLGASARCRRLVEVAKAVVGQDAAVTGLVIALLIIALRPRPARGGARHGQDAAGPRAGGGLDARDQAGPVHPDLMPGDVTGSLVYDRAPPSSPSARGRSSPTCCWPTRSTGRRPRPRRRCSRRWRSVRSPSTACRGRCRAVHGRRDPEPGGVRRHLPAARGPAGPVPAQARLPLPPARTRSRCWFTGTRPASTRATSPPPAFARSPGPPISMPPGRRRTGDRLPRGHRLRRRHRPGHPAVPVAVPGRSARAAPRR